MGYKLWYTLNVLNRNLKKYSIITILFTVPMNLIMGYNFLVILFDHILLTRYMIMLSPIS